MNISLPRDPVLLAARLLLAYIFIMAGYGKIGGFAGAQGYMASAGVPGILLPLVIAAELGFGLMLAVGYQIRLAALGLAAFTLLAGILFHFQPSVAAQMVSFNKNLAITGGMLALAIAGPGAWSVDGRKGS